MALMADNDEITRNNVKEVKAKMRATVRRYDNSFNIRFYVEEMHDEAWFERVNICHNNINPLMPGDNKNVTHT